MYGTKAPMAAACRMTLLSASTISAFGAAPSFFRRAVSSSPVIGTKRTPTFFALSYSEAKSPACSGGMVV